jgi:hypothetical protein
MARPTRVIVSALKSPGVQLSVRKHNVVNGTLLCSQSPTPAAIQC